MRTSRLGTAATLAALAGVLLFLACGDPTGPDELEKGTFRAELSGAVEGTLDGDTNFTFVRIGDTSEPAWILRLSYPAGTGSDSIQIRFVQRVASVNSLPNQGTYPVATGPISQDTTVVNILVRPDAELAEELFVGQSGTFTVTEAAEGEVLAGRFDLTARRSEGDSLSETVSATGSFRSGVP